MRRFTKFVLLQVACLGLAVPMLGCLLHVSPGGIALRVEKDKKGLEEATQKIFEIEFVKLISMVVDTGRALFEAVSNPLGAVVDWIFTDLLSPGKKKTTPDGGP